MKRIDKRALLEALRASIAEEIATMTRIAREAAEAATHEENKPEGDKDMRSTEASYIARGQAERVLELERAYQALGALELKSFDRKTPIVSYATEPRDGEREFLIQSGARDHFVKPLDPARLKILIESAIQDCWLESMAARIAEHAAVLEELKQRSKAVHDRSAETWSDSERLRNRLLRLKAYRAFLEAGGIRANFHRIWPEMADAFGVGRR